MKFLANLVASALGTLIALAIVVFIGFLFLFIFIAAADQEPSVADGSVLVIDFNGAVPETVSGDPLTQALSGEPPFGVRDLVSGLRMAAVDDRVEAVWLQMRNVGGTWAALQEVRSALVEFKESGKPVYASADDFAMTEGSYFIASAADSVFASTQSVFEFNGFATVVTFFQNTLEMLDVEPQIVRAGNFKSAVEPFMREDLSPENEEQLTAMLETLNDVFMASVGESRGISPDSLKQLASERAIISAEDAMAAGLLDQLIYRDEVIDVIKARLDVSEDDDLETVSMRSYMRVSPSDAGLEVNDEGEIAVVYAVGQIVSGESGTDLFGATSLGAETFNKAIREARENDRVDAVVVRIDSPGGSASASDAMWREIRLTDAVKPVIISMGGVAASGGYWMAAGADTVVADPLTITGSIGVFAMFFDASGFFENKLGITFDQVQTSPYADVFSGVSELSPEERQMLEGYVDQTYDDFLERVAEARGLSTSDVDSIAQGRVWMGREALEIGLVDTLGTLSTAIELAAEAAGIGEGPHRVRVLPRPKTFVEQLAEQMSARASAVWMRWTTSPAERALLEQARYVRGAVGHQGQVMARMPLDITLQ